jgi:hypothetical protein
MAEEKRRPKPGWRQQKFKTLICFPTPVCLAIFFFLLCVLSTILSAVILTYSYKITEKRAEILNNQAQLTLTQSDIDAFDGAIYLYIETEDYYQNHRIYSKSKSILQLHNAYDSTLSTDCDPLNSKSDLFGDLEGKITQFDSNNNIIPCGLMPASFVNISLTASRNSVALPIDSSNINWPTDDDQKFKSLKNSYIDVTDSHFKVWMRTAPTSTLRKFYGKISENDAKAGDYSFLYKERAGKSSAANILGYEPKIKVLLTNTTRIGGKSFVLGWSFCVVAGASLIWGVIFVIAGKVVKMPTFEEQYQSMRRTT